MKIQAERVTYQYESYPVLHNINLEIAEGTLTVLCGVTGSGKSTLLRLLAGLDIPASGKIIYDTQKEASQGISMVFQLPETQLFAGSVHKEVEYGLEQRRIPKAERTAIIRSALAETGLPYEEFSGRSPFLLSGGEKRRLCIAGAMASRPGLLILDEPTAGLDPQAAQSLLRMVQDLRSSGLTLIIGTHDLDSFLPIADEAVVMLEGSVFYQGPASELAADPLKLSEAGLEPPAYARIGRLLQKRGLLEQTPDSLEDLLGELGNHALPAPADSQPRAFHSRTAAVSSAGENKQPLPSNGRHNKTAPGRLRWQGLDPRVKWLGMMLGSLVILGMHSLFPLLLSAALITGLAVSVGLSWNRTVKFFRPFLLMFLFLWLLSALSWSSPDYTIGPLGFSSSGLSRGGINALRFLLLIALGFLFTETTTGTPLREALEWAIAPLKRLGIRTRNWSLVVSITLQFVPWILSKLTQLQLALASRGGRKSRLMRWTPRQIVLLVVPLLILIIGMGDELSTAIESRGYDPKKERTPSYRLEWRRGDTIVCLCILLAAAGLWWCARIS